MVWLAGRSELVCPGYPILTDFFILSLSQDLSDGELSTGLPMELAELSSELVRLVD